MSELDVGRMVDAYVRRKRWEAMETAVAIWSVIGEAIQGQKGQSTRSTSTPKQAHFSQVLRKVGQKL